MWLIETNEFVRTGSSFASEHFKMPLATFCRTDRCEASLWWTLIRAIGFSVNDVCRCSLSSFCFSSFFFFHSVCGWCFDILIKASAYQICQAIFFTYPLYSTCLSSFWGWKFILQQPLLFIFFWNHMNIRLVIYMNKR